MARTVYVNGSYVSERNAVVHYEDRGYQFSDGVYEVILVRRGRLIDEIQHLDRLERSLRELSISMPMRRPPLEAVIHETLRRNFVQEGIIYLQVTRGVAPRDHTFPKAPISSLVVAAKRRNWPASDSEPKGGLGVFVRDERWARCDVKSISLLPNVLAKEKAKQLGAVEAILVSDDGTVTEGGSSNVWIVDRNGALHTHPLGPEILGGVTRGVIKRLAEDAQISVVEEPFDRNVLMNAREVFVTSATSFVKPILNIDGVQIGDGKVGPVTSRIFSLYNAHTLAG